MARLGWAYMLYHNASIIKFGIFQCQGHCMWCLWCMIEEVWFVWQEKCYKLSILDEETRWFCK